MRELIDTHEASSYLGIAEQTLANWRWRGIGPSWIKVGGRVKYDRGDLDAWLAANRETADGPTTDAA